MTQIWLSGSSGTGKTTTGKILAQKMGLDLIDGISRKSPFKMFTLEHQQYISKSVFNLKDRESFISCRNPFDVTSYSIAFDVPNGSMDSLHSLLFAKSNPNFIFFPFGQIPIEEDGFRPTSLELNKKVDIEIKKQLKYYNVEYYEVQKESANSRANSIIKYLEEKWQN